MKDNVEIYTMALVKVIHESNEYKAFERIKSKLASMPEVKKEINTYRKEAYILQNFGDITTLYERTEQFQAKYKSLKENPLVEEYLRNELAVCCMLRDVMTKLMEGVDLEIKDFVGEIRILKENNPDS